MFRWGIRNRLILSYIILIFVTLTLLGSYFLWYFYRHNLQGLTDNLRIQAEIVQELLIDRMSNRIEKASLDPIIKELSTKIDMRITIIDLDGTVLADSWENPTLMENHNQRPEILTALDNGYGSSVRYSSTLSENLLYVAIPMHSKGEIVGIVRVSTTLAHVDQGYNEIRSMLLLAFLLASLLAIGISVRLARRYMAPLEEITRKADLMSAGNLNERVHISTGDELELLAHTLNNLCANLDDKINEISAEKSKLELIFRHTNSAIILLDRFGQVTSVNKAAIDIFRIKTPFTGIHNLQVIGNSNFATKVQDTIAQKEKRTIELRADIHGNKHAFQVSLAPITNILGEVNAILAVFYDVTALIELREKQAEFIANASHELATPLTAIKGFAETLLDGALNTPELATRFIGIISTEAERMDRLIKDLLQMAKLDFQDYRKGIPSEPTPIEPLVSATILEFASHWQRKEQSVTMDPPPFPLAVIANPDWLKQVIINLVDNAIKYTPAGGKITISWRIDKEMVALRVKDSGPGIPPQDLPRIFDRFYRVDRARTRTAGGTGLGLAIVKFIIELFSGTVEAKSELGIGTTFIMRLPIAK